ncbi:hypothetical protein HD554DRAFT_2013448 [Boletus coccyginus]|nr:hypothetical protein HD554DRAFT_2013448 [Boletus coccyginus]
MPHADAHNTLCAGDEAPITSSHGSRTARPSTLSPGPGSLPITPLHSAISDQYTANQDVLHPQQLLNQRPISHHPSLSPNPGHQVSLPTLLESSILSSPTTRHVAINSHSARPRSSNQDISDLAAHYGIPQFLPVAPRTTPRRTTDPEEGAPDFANLCSNYLTMLSQNPGDDGANHAPTQDSALVAAGAEVTDADAIRSLMDILGATAPEFQMSDDLNEFLTSPPIDSPFDDDLLITPAVGSDMQADMMSSPLMGDFGNDSFGEFPSLFSEFNSAVCLGSKPPQDEPPLFPHLFNLDKMYSLETPNTPFIDSPNLSPFDRKVAPLPSAKRKFSATCTRKNVTLESLVSIDAPTQLRKYVTPSATSQKELPATWRRKRLRTAGPGEEDQLVEALNPALSEQEQIEAKRRQNMIAARRSRKRKLEC